ncbi:MAG TPA: hypothetical protein VHG28_02990 [Longimicrobiaceae bacterium]|nr:hypothetical protein [Longimicrobiaceae bacterium]
MLAIFARIFGLSLLSSCGEPTASTDPAVPPAANAFAGMHAPAGDTSATPQSCTDCIIEPTEPVAGSGGNGIVIDGITLGGCTDGDSEDRDQDGLEDYCEYRIALAWAPILRFTQGDGDPTRETYWAVLPKPATAFERQVSIIYLLGYHNDTGALGHAGDSEFIILNIAGGTTWTLKTAFYSAHWRAGWDRSEWYDNGQLNWAGVGHPISYVAEGKHANYNSAARCNQSADICGPQHFNEPVDVYATRNVGSPWATLVDCIPSVLPAYYAGEECFWTRRYFRGWRNSDTHAGMYRDALDYFASFPR